MKERVRACEILAPPQQLGSIEPRQVTMVTCDEEFNTFAARIHPRHEENECCVGGRKPPLIAALMVVMLVCVDGGLGALAEGGQRGHSSFAGFIFVKRLMYAHAKSMVDEALFQTGGPFVHKIPALAHEPGFSETSFLNLPKDTNVQ